jgi:hypothetical protein
MLVIVLQRSRVAPLLEEIRLKAAIADLVYWIEPIAAFGRLARAEAPTVLDPQAAA